MDTNNKAYLFSNSRPSNAQIQRFESFLKQKYHHEFVLVFKEDFTITSGFKLVVGDEVYDWTQKERLRQFGLALDAINASPQTNSENIISMFKSTMENWKMDVEAIEQGIVTMVEDGIVFANGLDHAVYGEIVVFESGVKGMIQDLQPTQVGIILFGDESEVCEGSVVYRTKKEAGIPVGNGYIGRVLDPLGNPIDEKGEVESQGFSPIEVAAPNIIDRASVEVPLQTGILCIDSMFPIGRGQRELIIGDRQTGKTAIAVDTILNQKGQDVICIYVSIGQKSSSVAQLVSTLESKGAMEYTIVFHASASDSASLQYIVPYSATSMGEYFMHQGKDVLIVYDDLSKHAIAYRALSLLLERSPGREAYPGDVFYLHSRLLERSAQLSLEAGGGSMSALPIVETQAGDVSAYIPTNIISITDGQIFLESELFYAGQRPAINVGLSVSRVGSAAQAPALKKATGTIRLDLAQYREMEVFTQFSNDLDPLTKKQLAYGQGLMYLLRQPQSQPLSLHEQVILLVAGTARVMQDIPMNQILAFRGALLEYFASQHASLCQDIETKRVLSDEQKEYIIKYSQKFLKKVGSSYGASSTD